MESSKTLEKSCEKRRKLSPTCFAPEPSFATTVDTRSSSGGGHEFYFRGNEKRIRCLRCLAHAAAKSSKKFIGTHSKCGANRVRGEYRNSAKLPSHIVIEMQQLIDAPDTQRRVLVCKGCSGVGGLSNRTRFVSLHLNCLNGQRRSGRYIPTKAAIQTCEIAVGRSLKDLSKVSRERAMKAMVH